MEKRSNHRQKHSRFIYAVWKMDLDDADDADALTPELENLLQEQYARHPKKLVRFVVEDTDVTDTGNGLNDTTE